ADFIAERPQPTRVPEISFFAEVLALIVCPFGLVIFAISLVFLSGVASRPRRRDDSDCPHLTSRCSQPLAVPMTSSKHFYEVRPRKDHRGFDLISDALPFGCLLVRRAECRQQRQWLREILRVGSHDGQRIAQVLYKLLARSNLLWA